MSVRPGDFARSAAELVSGSRNVRHGEVEETFGNTATLWNAYLAVRRDPAAPLDGVDVAHLMVLLKLARTQGGEINPDDWVDAVGYADLAGMLACNGGEKQTEMDLRGALPSGVPPSWWESLKARQFRDDG